MSPLTGHTTEVSANAFRNLITKPFAKKQFLKQTQFKGQRRLFGLFHSSSSADKFA
jgi:hypothetical protein